MKIAIVGAGISGLTTYLFLKKLLPSVLPSSGAPLEIVIYEKHHAPNSRPGSGSTTVGGALGIAPNGLRVLRALDEDLFQKVVAQGYSISHFGMYNANGWELARIPATDFGSFPVHTVLISRQTFWECLRESIEDKAVGYANVTGVTRGDTQRPQILFANGSDFEADLVIGADGVRSVVRKAITGNGKVDDYPPTYE